MRNVIRLLIVTLLTFSPYSAFAILSMELTQGVSGAIPIAVVPFAQADNAPQNVSSIIGTDLRNSGRFKVFGKDSLSQFPSEKSAVSADYFRKLGTDNVVIGKINRVGDRYEVSFSLLNMYNSGDEDKVVMSDKFTVSASHLRSVAHHISDLIYENITGTKGIFSTRLVYVVVQGKEEGHRRYILELSDHDGYNPKPLLNSPEPIMSPSWSPDGRKIAYVSFENRTAGIYIQEVGTGGRSLLSKFPGINGAPAWSPDGRKLALVLSKSGSPNIYIMDIGSRKLRQITNDFYINTEPSWTPDGSRLLFTSNRSGGPQIYSVNTDGGSASRVTYDGDYNARASFAKDGKNIAIIHRVSGLYKIALLDLDTGSIKVLNKSSGDSASPSIAPNGSMVLYDTVSHGRNVLGMVSSDGRVMLELPARNGQAQDPAWSPFLG